MDSWISEASSLGDLFHRNCGKYADKVVYRKPTKGGYVDLTYSQAHDEAFKYAKALLGLGLLKGDTVALVSESCMEWALTDWAAQTLGLILVPIYPTLPADQAMYIAQDCGAKLIIAQDDKQAAKFSGLSVVLLKDGLLNHTSDISLEEWKMVSKGIDRKDVATVIYTSGTTGQPKGAMLTHAGFLDLSATITEVFRIGSTDTFLSFLPMAHVFERYAGHILPVAVGATVAYAGSLASLANDMLQVKPTVMCAVPRFFENLRVRITDNMLKQSPFKQKLFHWALDQGTKKARGQFAPFFVLADALVGKKIRERTGGHMRFFVSGGAALAPQVSEFYIAFGLTILQGYGLTENTAASCLNRPEDNRPWTVGPPIPGVEVKLASDGEILTRGTANMVGYLHLPDATAEAIDSEGWFHTGDIGVFEGENLKITDRKKDILVLANGKNVAPQKIEAKLKESDFINEAVVFGDGMEHCVALVVPEFDRVKSWLAAQGHPESDPHAIVQSEQAKGLIKGEIDKANKELADFERVKKHGFIDTPFSVETGELTPSLKVRRKFVREKYAEQVEALKRGAQ